MSLLLTIDHLKVLLDKVGVVSFFHQLLSQMEKDYAAWASFQKVPRLATHYPHGVIELMPISNDERFAFKYVNGHPNNPDRNKLTVAALGLLADVETGYPLLISEMTLLTAFRTAAASALASRYLAREDAKSFGLIGTGAQSEFQTLAHAVALNITDVFYYDIDALAMKKFEKNMSMYEFNLHPCDSVDAVVASSDIVTTATADKVTAVVLDDKHMKPGLHINAVGGDCPGKTELDFEVVKQCKIVVQYLSQTREEGEIQHLTTADVYAELWELVAGKKPGREDAVEITLFDSVGFAIEDFSVLVLVYHLARKYNLGDMPPLVPDLEDPKNIFSLLI